MKIFINPGHAYDGIPDPGATNKEMNLRECDIALSVGQKVKHYLEAVGYEVMLLQNDNLAGESSGYQNVTATANEWEADVFVSLHCNAFNAAARGIETLCFDPNGGSGELANCIQDQLVTTLQAIDPNIPDRSVKQRRDLAVLKYTDMPAVLVEMAFIDETNDAKLLVECQDDIARAVARGITDYYA